MRRNLARTVTTASLRMIAASLLLTPPASAQSRRALLIGIDHYEAAVPNASRSGAPATRAASDRALITDLDGAINDAESVRDLLVARFGFPADNVRLLQNAQATRAGILAAIQKLADDAHAGDVVVFYYAGHGSERRNSLSNEPSKRDQTIVPADANSGAFDIRDKELARAFDALIDKGVTLTLIFDSCHSGSIVRGVPVVKTIRWAAYDPRDAADSSNPPRPEDHGALVLSAAQDYQTAGELQDDDSIPHGVFTSALVKTLRQAPQDEPAVEIFQSIKAIMQSEGLPQEPVLAGTLERRKRALLGGIPGAAGRTAVAILRVKDSSTVELQGGVAIGIRPGAELAQLEVGSGKAPVRLRVSGVSGASRSTARVIAGSAAALPPGTQFAIDAWAAPTDEALRVWLPPAMLTAAALRAVATELSGLRGTAQLEWVDDPAAMGEKGAPLFTLLVGAAGWELRPPAGPSVALGATVTAPQVAAAIRQRVTGPARLFVMLPPSVELRRQLRLGRGTANDAVQLSPSMPAAQYLLVGRIAQGGPEYAWVLPNATQEGLPSSALPVRTDWIAVTGRDALAGSELDDFALRIAKLRAWLRLESPPDDGRFPYRLALKNTRTGQLLTEGPVHDGEGYGLVIRADSARIQPSRVEKRRVYVFAIDSHGAGTLLYPQSDVLNRFPLEQPDGKYPAEIPLGDRELFKIAAPFGVDTYILLTTDEAISTDALAWEGVRTRGAGNSALTTLLSNTGAATRGPQPTTPAHWSIMRLTIKSMP